MADISNAERIRGSLLGGAVGDALGAAVEFLSLRVIREKFGADGISDYSPAYGRRGAITDDTQMTLLTAEDIIRARIRQQSRGICNTTAVIHHAYLRWLLTQGERPAKGGAKIGKDGWLFAAQALHSRRAPGGHVPVRRTGAAQPARAGGHVPVRPKDRRHLAVERAG